MLVEQLPSVDEEAKDDDTGETETVAYQDDGSSVMRDSYDNTSMVRDSGDNLFFDARFSFPRWPPF